jgi:hypothetical protein
VHCPRQQLLVGLVDVEHDVAELVEVLRGDVADRGDRELVPADGDEVPDSDRDVRNSVVGAVDDAHVCQRVRKRLGVQDEDATCEHVARFRSDADDGRAVVGHLSPEVLGVRGRNWRTTR